MVGIIRPRQFHPNMNRIISLWSHLFLKDKGSAPALRGARASVRGSTSWFRGPNGPSVDRAFEERPVDQAANAARSLALWGAAPRYLNKAHMYVSSY